MIGRLWGRGSVWEHLEHLKRVSLFPSLSLSLSYLCCSVSFSLQAYLPLTSHSLPLSSSFRTHYLTSSLHDTFNSLCTPSVSHGRWFQPLGSMQPCCWRKYSHGPTMTALVVTPLKLNPSIKGWKFSLPVRAAQMSSCWLCEAFKLSLVSGPLGVKPSPTWNKNNKKNV